MMKDEFSQRQFENSLLLSGNDERAAVLFDFEVYLRGLDLERYRVNSMALADFGKDCKVTYREYMQNI